MKKEIPNSLLGVILMATLMWVVEGIGFYFTVIFFTLCFIAFILELYEERN